MWKILDELHGKYIILLQKLAKIELKCLLKQYVYPCWVSEKSNKIVEKHHVGSWLLAKKK